MTSHRRDMLRLALTPRWLVAALVLLVLVAGAVLLGRWQWERTQSILAAERAAVAQPIPVQEVFAGEDAPPTELPAEGIGRPVTVTGVYADGMHTLVTSRELDGRPGVWVVDGIDLGDGTVSAVLRGWLPDGASPGAQPPAGEVTVTGILHPDETFYADALSEPGTAASIAHDRLAEQWQATVLPGYVTLAGEDPSSSPAPMPVPPTVQTSDVPFPLQNFFYAFQWWIFAAFGVAVYLRWLWTESARADEDAVVT
jgi:cytochrome oxidase assembly protein ShyY1